MPSGWDSIQEPKRAIASYIGENAGSSRDGREAWTNRCWWIIDIVGPAILLIVLIWLVMRRRSTGKTGAHRAGDARALSEEEQRRREGTDDL